MTGCTFIKTAALAGISCALAGPASAGSLTRLDTDHVSVQVTGTPVGSVLNELNDLFPMDYLYIEPAIQSRRVSVHIDSVRMADAAVQILEKSGLDFIVWSNRIYVGDPTAAVQIGRAGNPSVQASVPRDAAVVAVNERAGQAADVVHQEDSGPASRPNDYRAAAQSAAAGTPQPSAAEPEATMPAQTEEQALAAATFETAEYKMVGESVTYSDPNFVTYKMRPEVVKRRLNTDIALIP